jgi:hypothetical protein
MIDSEKHKSREFSSDDRCNFLDVQVHLMGHRVQESALFLIFSRTFSGQSDI